MKTREHTSGDPLKDIINASFNHTAPEGFTHAVMQGIYATEVSRKPSLRAWLNEYIYYILAVLFLGATGLYFSGPFNLGYGTGYLNTGISWNEVMSVVQAKWTNIFQESAMIPYILLALMGYALLDLLIRRRMKLQF